METLNWITRLLPEAGAVFFTLMGPPIYAPLYKKGEDEKYGEMLYYADFNLDLHFFVIGFLLLALHLAKAALAAVASGATTAATIFLLLTIAVFIAFPYINILVIKWVNPEDWKRKQEQKFSTVVNIWITGGTATGLKLARIGIAILIGATTFTTIWLGLLK